MRVLVTGGLGFIGHAVTVDLRQVGYDVTVLRRDPENGSTTTSSGATIVSADLRDRERIFDIVKHGSYDAVVHLGGLPRPRESFAEPLDYFDVNVGGTLNLLRALETFPAAAGPTPLIYPSTTLVYGSRRVGSVDESLDPSPETPYADTESGRRTDDHGPCRNGGLFGRDSADLQRRRRRRGRVRHRFDPDHPRTSRCCRGPAREHHFGWQRDDDPGLRPCR